MAKYLKILVLTTVCHLGVVLTVDPFLPIAPCSKSSDCLKVINDSYCNFDTKIDCNVGTCLCIPSRVPVPDNSSDPESKITCVAKPEIGQECKHNDQCIATFGEYSVCSDTNKTCECKTGTELCKNESLKVKKCVIPRKLGEPCDGCDNQCKHIPNAYCSSSNSEDPYRCSCTGDYMENDSGTECIQRVTSLGSSCTSSQSQCRYIPDSICEENICACNATTHIANADRECLPKRSRLHMECQKHIQCLPDNSLCIEGACVCPDSFVQSQLKPDTCLMPLSLGETCQETIQCTGNIGANAECVGVNGSLKTCRCKHGYVYDLNNDLEFGRCFPVTPLGGICRAHENCVDAIGSNKLARCSNGICSCLYEDVMVDGICYDRKSIGYNCENTLECQLWMDGPVFCMQDSKTCQCDEHYRYAYSNGRDKCISNKYN